MNVECAGFVESGSKLVTATQPRTILFGHLCMIVGNVASLRTWKICNTTEETAICIMRERGRRGRSGRGRGERRCRRRSAGKVAGKLDADKGWD